MTLEKAITIYDIAREASVSPSTVSRVLNGTTPVAASKHAAVLDAVQRLNFRPSVLARGVARGTTMIIGVLTQDIASPFYGEIMRGIQQGLFKQGYSMICVSSHWQGAEELQAFQMLSERRVDGLIMLGSQLPDDQLPLSVGQLSNSLVVVGRMVQGMEQRCLCVDNFAGAYHATRYLLELGHRRIAHIQGHPAHLDASERLRGYCQALKSVGQPVDQELIAHGSFDKESGMLAIERLLQRGTSFSAIFAANDQMAYGAYLALFRRGIRVPEHVSVIGFDDLPGSAYTTPPLTTVRQPTQEMGLAAAEAVLALLHEQPLAASSFEPSLVVRESVAPLYLA